MNVWLGLLLAGLIGFIVGIVEILVRYRDKPTLVFMTLPSWIYYLVNAFAAMIAYLLVWDQGWTFGLSELTAELAQSVVAGLGSAALFRLNIARFGDDAHDVGPSTILENLLKIALAAVDRVQSRQRIAAARLIMKDFRFETHAEDVLVACLTATATPNAEALTAMRERADALAPDGMTEAGRGLALGLLLIDQVGPDVLQAAVEAVAAAESKAARVMVGSDLIERPVQENVHEPMPGVRANGKRMESVHPDNASGARLEP